MKEAVFILALLGLIVVPWALASRNPDHPGMKFWAWFWSSVAVLLAGFELASKIHTGRTISQHFWAYGVDNPWAAAALSAAIASLAVLVIWHLAAGVLKRRKRRKDNE